ncbi:hypothetical protein MNB_SUP05-SYMBIONT-5-1271 [hydrothermal vent metagenome]|uniref:Uncharacterized protein n=1 Tax=hydrothermal vent metagenome TaxID=652676 RepID=A0A1W1E283_9ZZZZ
MKNQETHFGYKNHVNVDKDTKLINKYCVIPFIKSNDTKALIIVRFSVLKKPRIAISILGFLSTLKQTIINSF